jgi:hypothetical protein
MWKWIAAAAVIAAGLSIQACAPKKQNDCGYVQNVYGERISWKGSLPITLYVHSSVPPQYYGAIQAAAATWEKTAGRKLFNIVTTQPFTGPVDPHKDGYNVIYLMSNWESDRASEQARTSVYWVGDQIKEADIRLNSKFKFYWNQPGVGDEINIEALVLHEMGHVLGLKHKDFGGSVMATYLPADDDRVIPANTDVSALQCEY